MVTWGPNQVFNIGSNAPPTPAFGSTPAPSFGAAPATTGGLFGAPAPGGSLFGSPSPAPGGGGGLFGNPPSTGLFGAPAPSSGGGGLFGSASTAPAPLFGSPAPVGGGLFGSSGAASAQTSATQAIPAQAAIQAHMDASARQEAAKLQSALEELYQAYSGTSTQKANPLVTIVYNTMTSEQLQWQFANSQMGNSYVIPPKPPQVSEQTWLEAVVNNPDRASLIPVALIGAEALQARVGWQQDQAKQYADNLATTLQGAHESLQQRFLAAREAVHQLHRMHGALSSRLLRIMQKVELVRCMNIPLQTDEVQLTRRLQTVMQQLDQLTRALSSIAVGEESSTTKSQSLIQVPDKQGLAQLFREHRHWIVRLSETVQKEKRDVQLLKERVLRNS